MDNIYYRFRIIDGIYWYAPTVDPVLPGVYARDYTDGDKERCVVYCRYDGQYWYACADTPEHAKYVPAKSTVLAPWTKL